MENGANSSCMRTFCAECGSMWQPGDKFCRECGSNQFREVNVEPVIVDEKINLRASDILPKPDRNLFQTAMASDGRPMRGLLDPEMKAVPQYKFCPNVQDLSIPHKEPVVIRSTEIDVFNFRFMYIPAVIDGGIHKRYPSGQYDFHLIRTSTGARCRIGICIYNDKREDIFDTDAGALTRLDLLLKEHDLAQLDGYSKHVQFAANTMDLLVQYTSGEQIAATGARPQAKEYYDEIWFMDFFRSLSGEFGKNIFRDI